MPEQEADNIHDQIFLLSKEKRRKAIPHLILASFLGPIDISAPSVVLKRSADFFFSSQHRCVALLISELDPVEDGRQAW